MRIRTLLLGAFGLAAGAAAMALQAGSSMPDIAKQYHERRNCHGAYDVLVEDLEKNGSIDAADSAWAQSYEEAGKADQPCPAPPEHLAARAGNRLIVTGSAHGQLANYHDQNDAAAYYEAALSVLHGKVQGVEAKEGYAMLGKASELGDPTAQFMVGSLHVAGAVSGKPDYASAVPLVEKAAAAGHVDALFMAGNMYKEGLGPKADKRKAFDYYRQAAERGHGYAVIMAFNMINDGEGVKKDFPLAYRLARNMADRGEAYGAIMAASALLQQKDAKKHEDEVLYWMDEAERKGDAKLKAHVAQIRPQVVAAYTRAKAPPEYTPRVRKLCPLKTTCMVNSFSGLKSCTTNVDYWNDCDG